VNYIGSKHSLLRPFIEGVYKKNADGDEKVFCDLFAGTGAVGRFFKRQGLQVIANDIQQYAYVLNKAYLEINTQPIFTNLRKELHREFRPAIEKLENAGSRNEPPHQQVLRFLNHLGGKRGFITAHYSPVGNRLYYTKENAERADAIRQLVEQWREQGLLNEKEYYYILCSLLEAIDQVANTASVYGAFLKWFKKSALRPLQLKPLELSNHVKGCKVFRQDASRLIEKIRCDILYLDPPYNHRQYGANYHVLETIAAYDQPEIKGVTGMRDYVPSLYCKPKTAKAEFARLVATAKTKHILISYNDEGILSLDEVQSILRLRGKPKLYSTAYNRFKADSGREYKRVATVEYLHYVRVTKDA
jgi:adenine-specific DNA-methyltransferase